MAQFDVCLNPGTDADAIPYLLVVQSDLLDRLPTRVVVPLFRVDAFGPAARGLHPRFQVDGRELVMATHLLAGVAARDMGRPVTSLESHRDAIIAALDLVITGV